MSTLILQAEISARKFKKEILNNEKKITLRLLKEDEKVLKKEKEAKLNFDYEKAHRDSKVSFLCNQIKRSYNILHNLYSPSLNFFYQDVIFIYFLFFVVQAIFKNAQRLQYRYDINFH